MSSPIQVKYAQSTGGPGGIPGGAGAGGAVAPSKSGEVLLANPNIIQLVHTSYSLGWYPSL